MIIYLVRHTTPLNAKGLCYGFSDIDVNEHFLQEAEAVQKKLPISLQNIYCSPLIRCKKLAQYLFNNRPLNFEDDLREMNFGAWENKLWNDIAYQESKYWMDDFVHASTPNGESYKMLYNRVVPLFEKHIKNHLQGFLWVTHSGVIRSVLCKITNTDLQHSFAAFKIDYGAVVKIVKEGTTFKYEIL